MTEDRDGSEYGGSEGPGLASPDLSKMDVAELQSLRQQLLGQVGATRRADVDAPGDDPGGGEPGGAGARADAAFSAIRAIESQLLLVDDEIWRREDARVDAAILAAYAAKRATWSWVDQEWPLARPAWERESGSARDGGLSLLVWTGPPRQSARGARLESCWLLLLDEPRGCRLQGPLDKSLHALGCRCRLWSPWTECWIRLAKEGLVFQLDPGRQVEGVLLGRGLDTSFTHPATKLKEAYQVQLGTWLVRPPGRLPLRLLSSEQLDVVLPELVGQVVRLSRLPNVAGLSGTLRVQYSARPVFLPGLTGLGMLSGRERRLLDGALGWLREDWAGSVVDGLRSLGVGDGRLPALSRRDVLRRLSELVHHARLLLQTDLANAVERLLGAVSRPPERGGDSGGGSC